MIIQSRYTYNLSQFVVLLCALCALCACETAPETSSDDSSRAHPPKAEQPAMDKKILTQFSQLETDAKLALKKENIPKAKQLIERGIAKSQKEGRQYELSKANFLVLRGNLHRDANKTVDARRDYADAMAIFRVHKKTVGRFQVHLAQATLEVNKGDHAAASRELTAAKELLTHITDNDLLGEYLTNNGRLSASQMKHKDAAQFFLDAKQHFSSANNKEQVANTLFMLSACEDALGEIKQAQRSLEKAHQIYKKLENNTGRVRALHKLAAIAERERQYKKAKSLLETVRELYISLDRQSDAAKVNQHINALPTGEKKKK